jgi:Ribonuclease G/E
MTGGDLRLLIEDQPGLRRLAMVEVQGGRLVDLAVEMASGVRAPQAGDLYRGRVARLDRALEAAFVEVGSERQAFLPLSQAPPSVSEGDLLELEVRRAGGGAKGPKVTAALSEAARARLAAAGDGGAQGSRKPGLIAAAADPLEELLRAGPREIVVDGLPLCRALERRRQDGTIGGATQITGHVGDVPLWHVEDLEEALELRLAGSLDLPSGGRMIIEPGETLTAVDVDRGAERAGGTGTGAKATNLEAVAALARECRLRNLSGRIVVDFLEMAKAGDRKALEHALKAAFARDPEPIKLFPIGPSGLVELTRRRRRPPLHEILMYPVGELGRTWVRRPQVIAFAALRALRKARADYAGAAPLIAAAAPVVTALVSGEAAAARLALEERWGRGIEVAEQSELQTFELRRA